MCNGAFANACLCLCIFPDCLEPTGLENGDILDIKMSASSSFDDLRTAPGRARLNHPEGKVIFNFLAYLTESRQD